MRIPKISLAFVAMSLIFFYLYIGILSLLTPIRPASTK
jgi:hypothetical protein